MTFQLPKLAYSYNALEPYIDTKTMEIHHSKHHQTYLDKLNDALKNNPEFFKKSIEEILSNIDQVPENIRTAVKNNGGGYFHHSFFWEIMAPKKLEENLPKEETKKRIDQKFGSFENFKKELTNSALTQFGSGWAWLSLDKKGDLKVHSTSNQDSPVSLGLTPLLGIDVWEHAYYLNYQNRRADYINAWWNVVNWEKIEENLKSAQLQ